MGLVIKIIIKFRGCEPLIRALGAGFVKGLEANDRGIRFRADANLLAEISCGASGCCNRLPFPTHELQSRPAGKLCAGYKN